MFEELAEHIRRLTEDLKKLQEEINRAAVGDPAEAIRTQAFGEILDRKLINAFKSAVDHTRLLLWAHLEATGTKTGVSPQELLQKARMERVTEMLRRLREEMKDTHISEMPESRALLQEIAVTSGVMGRPD